MVLLILLKGNILYSLQKLRELFEMYWSGEIIDMRKCIIKIIAIRWFRINGFLTYSIRTVVWLRNFLSSLITLIKTSKNLWVQTTLIQNNQMHQIYGWDMITQFPLSIKIHTKISTQCFQDRNTLLYFRLYQ